MEVSKTSDNKDKSKEELMKLDVKNNENDVFTSFNDISQKKQNSYNQLKLTKNKSTNITDDGIKNTKHQFVNKEVPLNESLKDNYKTFDPKKEDIFKLSEIDESLELGREEEEENNLQNNHNNKFSSKEKSNIDLNNNQTSFKSDSFMQKSINSKSNDLSGVEKTKFYSEKIFTNSKKYFHNLQELISKKINNRKEGKFINKLNGDTNLVIPFWIEMGIQVDNYDSNNKKSKIDQENNEEKTKENVKCLTYREEATKTLEKFDENLEIVDKNNALSECNVNEYFIEKIEGNQCEINGIEKTPLKMLKVSNNEGFYEFNDNLNLYSDKGGKGDKPKINNERIKSEITHQINLNQYNPNNNNSNNSNSNSKTGDDYIITKENLSAKGFFRIDTNNTSVIKLPENYWTQDIDKKILVDLINENPTAKWEKIKVDTNIRIYKKKTIATINDFNMEEIFNAIANVDIRQKWDTLFSQFKIVEENKEEKSEVLYMSLKSPFLLIERRDFVQRRKIWHDFPDKNSVCIHFKSIDHPLCPIYKKIVRAHTYISGYFIKTESFDPPKCTVHIISQTDVKGKIPVWIVNKVSQTAPNDWVNNLIKGCKMVREKKLFSG